MVMMDEVEVADDALLPEVQGLKGPFGCLNRARYGISWGALGAAEFCFDAARQYGLTRQQFGRPPAAHRRSQKALANTEPESALGPQASICGGSAMRDSTIAPRPCET